MLIALMILLLGVGLAHGWSPAARAPRPAAGWPPCLGARRHLPARCCICINCKWVDRCATYHWVETQHEQPHVTEEPTFEPNDPQIQVFIRNERDGADGGEGGAAGAAAEGDSAPEQILEEVLDRTLLTTEFDVFKCDGFDEEKGKWLRLMPDADFIPT